MAYIVAPALGLTSIWLLGWNDPRPDILGKIISSVVFLLVYLLIVLGVKWNKHRKLQRQIRNAVLSRPRPPSADGPA